MGDDGKLACPHCGFRQSVFPGAQVCINCAANIAAQVALFCAAHPGLDDLPAPRRSPPVPAAAPGLAPAPLLASQALLESLRRFPVLAPPCAMALYLLLVALGGTIRHLVITVFDDELPLPSPQPEQGIFLLLLGLAACYAIALFLLRTATPELGLKAAAARAGARFLPCTVLLLHFAVAGFVLQWLALIVYTMFFYVFFLFPFLILCFVLLCFGLAITVKFLFAPFLLLDEGLGVWDALLRSRELARGYAVRLTVRLLPVLPLAVLALYLLWKIPELVTVARGAAPDDLPTLLLGYGLAVLAVTPLGVFANVYLATLCRQLRALQPSPA